MEIEPIAHIRTDFKEKFGIPRQSGYVKGCLGRVVFEPRYRNPDALRGLEGFSHIWLIFDFSENHRDSWEPMVRPPVLGGNEKVGVFASRSPFRPNSLGLSSVRLVSIEDTDEGKVLVVDGADMLDGTPIYDIKPYIRRSDCHEDAISGFADKASRPRLSISDPGGLLTAVPEDKRKTLSSCLEMDPRPSYHDDGRTYTMHFSDYDVSFTVDGDVLRITGIRKL
jgi:tRNA-Thr(GGU) m(6)t(6)A37 methyltransferase TsaA